MLRDPHWEKVDVFENFCIFRKLGDMVYEGDLKQPFSSQKVFTEADILRLLL
jgi:hypothetical protein